MSDSDDPKSSASSGDSASDGGNESFLSRWSRRKVAARAGEALPEPAASPPETERSTAVASDMPAELPPLDSLKGLESDYRAYLRPDVDDSIQRAALKKLFADPHFNQMDGLDVYIDDYGLPDPIPEAMLKTLEHAKALLQPTNRESSAAPSAVAPSASEDISREAPGAVSQSSGSASETQPAVAPDSDRVNEAAKNPGVAARSDQSEPAPKG